MALISTKNIVAPFTNKTNLVTLILVVVAFLFFRLAGGEIDIVNTSDENYSKQERNSFLEQPVERSRPVEYDSADTEKARSLEDIEEMFQ